MSTFKKNTAVTGFSFLMVSATDGSAITTGTVNGFVLIDGGTQAALTNSPAHEGNGQWSVNLTAGEMNGDVIGLLFTHTSAIPVHFTIKTDTKIVSELNDLSAAQVNAECDTAITDAALPTAAALATVDANVDAILVDTGTTLPGTLATLATASALATVDTVVDGIQSDLSNGTDGLGAIKAAVDAIPTSNPTAGAIADAVWDEALSGHATAGSAGATLSAAGSAGDPWATSLPGSYSGSQAGKVLADVLVDTADLQANQGNWLTATGFATSAALATVDANLDAVLVDTDATIPGLIAALNDLDAAGIRAALGLASADLDAQLAALPTAVENADALLNRDMSAVSDTNDRTPLQALRFLRNKWSVSGVTLTVTKEDDTTSAWTATLTADASANPVVGSDPA